MWLLKWKGQGKQMNSSKPVRAYLALGSNIGDRSAYIKAAIKMLKSCKGIDVVEISPFYNTSPVGYTEQPDFLNAVIAVDTILSPHELLITCLDIERRLGRIRTVHWGPRVIDIDIIFYNNEIINEGDLIIPHPRMQDREFVLKPLCDIASDFIHPVYNKSIKLLYEEWKAKEAK